MNPDIAKLLQHLDLLQQVGQSLSEVMTTMQHGLAMADMQINLLKKSLIEQEAWASRN